MQENCVLNNTLYEKKVLKFWGKKRIIKKILNKPSSQVFEINDGPTNPTNKVHIGHMTSFVLKDIITRYANMHGSLVKRSFGWDSHGIHFELEARELTINDESVQDYHRELIENCKKVSRQYQHTTIQILKEMGLLIDFENSFSTSDDRYIESVWSSIAELYKKGLLYKNYGIFPYSLSTGKYLSQYEIEKEAYSVFKYYKLILRYKVSEFQNTYILIENQNIWDIPINVAIGINNYGDYITFNSGSDKYILTKELFNKAFNDERNYKKFNIEKLKRKTLNFNIRRLGILLLNKSSFPQNENENIFLLSPYDHHHIKILSQNNISWVEILTEHMDFNDYIDYCLSKNIKEGTNLFEHYLQDKGLIVKKVIDIELSGYVSKKQMIYRLRRCYSISVNKIKPLINKCKNNISWFPRQINNNKTISNWIENMNADWNISRFRYWGIPLPIWESGNGSIYVLSSIKELEKLSGVKVTGLHRDSVDNIEFLMQGETYRRIEDTLDVKYETAAMFFAKSYSLIGNYLDIYPATLISEGRDQLNNWFLYQHILAISLFGLPAYKNILIPGFIKNRDAGKINKRNRKLGSIKDLI